jgi:hypothetical protein
VIDFYRHTRLDITIGFQRLFYLRELRRDAPVRSRSPITTFSKPHHQDWR